MFLIMMRVNFMIYLLYKSLRMCLFGFQSVRWVKPSSKQKKKSQKLMIETIQLQIQSFVDIIFIFSKSNFQEIQSWLREGVYPHQKIFGLQYCIIKQQLYMSQCSNLKYQYYIRYHSQMHENMHQMSLPEPKNNPNQTNKTKSQVTVVCRVKPLKSTQQPIQMKIDKQNAEIQITQTRQQTTKTFAFNRIYTDETQQQFVDQSCRPILKSILEDQKGYLIFSYGVTNSGKTHTILGSEKQPGILPYLIRNLSINKQVLISAIQLYNDEFFSLSSKKKIIPKQIGGFLDFSQCGIKEIINTENMDLKFEQYLANRTQNDTNVNKKSSRSHAIFRIQVNGVVIGVVDLAGSQRTNRVYADIDETLNINKSLLCLGRCIKALNQNSNPSVPIPYRQSKLTRVLIEYFAGRVQVLMIANISQAQDHFHENMKVLDYAIMAKDIRHCSTINSIMKSKSKKKVCKIDIFEALSKSSHKHMNIHQKSLKSSRKIASSMDHLAEQENLKRENQKYLRLIKKLQIQKNLRRIEGSLQTYEYISNLIDIEGEKEDQEKMKNIKQYTYQSPGTRKINSIETKDAATQTSPEKAEINKEEQIRMLREQLQKLTAQEKIMLDQQTFITDSFKKSYGVEEMKTPVKNKVASSYQTQNQSFIKKSCKSIYDSVKKILTGNIESLSLKKATTSNKKSVKSSRKKDLTICSNICQVNYHKDPDQIIRGQRKQFSFQQKGSHVCQYGTQVDFISMINEQKQIYENSEKENYETQEITEETLGINQSVTEVSVRNSAIKIQENIKNDNDDETQSIDKDFDYKKTVENENGIIKKNKTKKTKSKRGVDRAKKVAETRKLAAKLCRENTRTPLKNRLRHRRQKQG